MPRLRQEDTIKVNLKRTGSDGVDWFNLIQNQCRDLLKMVTKFQCL